ncbi:MerR family transcriptional regulator [Saccharopolyspora dendranthemae]|uniref:MerR family transcriptional regulator n=1 Tax=Saccharopolyspora dendranthemae TaxID=1181886 RepID=A0A561U2D3_9PSEU|nr:MerR family transcriptional regulator [Saccharopolyspora dendranthemae]TWF93519.1 MerR family transcriptional regulator [Saccharopolyspora dendranthemae]
MAWSTREIADLTNTTVKAVRHYHEIGLLDVPERTSNGYKQYGVSHLIRLVQIKRLSDLGLPLSQIASLLRADAEPDEAISALDAELEETIDRLTRIRSELAVIRRHDARPDVPTDFAPISGEFTDTQRSMLAVYSTIFSESDLAEFREMLAEPEETDMEFELLPADADDAALDQLAERMAPVVRRNRQRHPRLVNPAANSPRGRELAESTMAHAVAELYNRAQITVLQRVYAILEQDGAE